MSHPTEMIMLCHQAHSFTKDIDGCVGISVKGCPTFGTDPVPYLEVFRARPLSSTRRTNLAGGKESVYGYEPFPVPLRLIDELPSEFTPACIGNGFRQLMISHHVFRCKIFNADHIVLTNDSG